MINSQQPTANSQQSTANSQQPTKFCHPELVSGSNKYSLIGKILNAINGTLPCNAREARKQEELRVQDDKKRVNSYSLFTISYSPRPAFTLAEVLITLGIIGVVAQMTIPTLMQGVEDQSTVAALKKSYSTLSQAYTMAVSENGTPDQWGLPAGLPAGAALMAMLKPYLKINKDCGAGGNCFPSEPYKYLYAPFNWGTANGVADYGSMQLADGSIWASNVTNTNCTTSWGTAQALQHICGYFYVDVNGFKKPNQVGKDFFLFYLTKDSIIPVGTPEETMYGFPNQCIDAAASGWGCTAWVIYNENRDYLKCPGTLSWNGKTKCD